MGIVPTKGKFQSGSIQLDKVVEQEKKFQGLLRLLCEEARQCKLGYGYYYH